MWVGKNASDFEKKESMKTAYVSQLELLLVHLLYTITVALSLNYSYCVTETRGVSLGSYVPIFLKTEKGELALVAKAH